MGGDQISPHSDLAMMAESHTLEIWLDLFLWFTDGDQVKTPKPCLVMNYYLLSLSVQTR